MELIPRIKFCIAVLPALSKPAVLTAASMEDDAFSTAVIPASSIRVSWLMFSAITDTGDEASTGISSGALITAFAAACIAPSAAACASPAIPCKLLPALATASSAAPLRRFDRPGNSLDATLTIPSQRKDISLPPYSPIRPKAPSSGAKRC